MSGMLGVGSSELPELPTIEERVAWLLGKMLQQAPTMARPILRSMLLPRLEQLPSEALIETLGIFRDQILPWLLDDQPVVPSGDPLQSNWCYACGQAVPTGEVHVERVGLSDQAERALRVPGTDGIREDDPSGQADQNDRLPDGGL